MDSRDIGEKNIRAILKTSSFGAPKKEDDELCWKIDKNLHSISYLSTERSDVKKESYEYDNVYDEKASNEEIYHDCMYDYCEKVMSGMSCFILGCGETNGEVSDVFQGNESSQGIITMITERIIQMIERDQFRKYILRVSVLEIVNEVIRDLLSDTASIVDIANIDSNKYMIACNEMEFSSLEVFKNIVIDGFTRKNTQKLNDIEYEKNHTVIVRIICESRDSDEANYHRSGDIVQGELQFVLLPSIDTIDLDMVVQNSDKAKWRLCRGITEYP